MKKTVRLIMLGILGLVSCTTTLTTESASTLMPTVLSTETVFPMATNTATFTLIKSPTETPTPSPTLSPEQYPNLVEVALTYDDIPSDDINRQFFENVSIKDISENMKTQFDCSLDCNGELWTIPSFSISIMLIKLESNEDAHKLSESLCLETGEKPYTLKYADFEITNYDDCVRVIIGQNSKSFPNTWILPVSRKEAVLGTTFGSIFIFIRAYHAYPGDDFGGDFFLPLTQFANYQKQKLSEFGIPVNP